MDVRTHYDKKASDKSPQHRTDMQKHHNLAKRVALTLFAHDATRVLDLACGRGGDIPKWCALGIQEVVGLDISRESVEEAKARYINMGSPFSYTFLQRDVRLGYESKLPFDVVTCMFAMHYFFDTEGNAKALLRTAACNLKPGGIFVGIVPDALQINERIKFGPFDNGVMQVTALWPEKPACFGSKYTCSIQGTVTEDSCVPEYLVYGSVLEKLAALYDMTPVPIQHELFHSKPPLHQLHPPYGEPYASCTAMFAAFAFVKGTKEG